MVRTPAEALRLTKELQANLIRISSNFLAEQNIREARERLQKIHLELTKLESVAICDNNKAGRIPIKIHTTFH